MKKFFKTKRSVIISFFIISAAAASVFYFFHISGRNEFQAHAGAGENVSGFAWSENIGWISFNKSDCIKQICRDNATHKALNFSCADCAANGGTCVDWCVVCDEDGTDNDGTLICDSGDLGDACGIAGTCVNNDYGVNVDPATGNFSGYAWNASVGWISFEENTPPDSYAFNASCGGTCDAAGACTACLNLGDKKIYGWAQIHKLTNNGWISLNSKNCDSDENGFIDAQCGSDNNSVASPVYNLSVGAGGEFSGWAWHGGDFDADGLADGFGWISFNCADTGSCGDSNYKVAVNAAPAAPAIGNIVEMPGQCKLAAVQWADNSTNESGFVVEQYHGGGPWTVFCSVNPDIVSCTGLVLPNTTYQFRVKAKGIIDSDWSPDASGKTVSFGYCAPELDELTGNCDKIDLHWSQAGLIDGAYKIFRDKDAAGWSEISEIAADPLINAYDYSDTDVVSGSAYRYYIQSLAEDLPSNIRGPQTPCPNLPTWKEVRPE